MSEEKHDKEGKRVAERIAAVKRDDAPDGIVIADNISKEVNALESVSRRAWSKKYGYLSGRFFRKVLAEECRKAGFPVDTLKRDPPEDAVKHSPIPLKPSPAVPRTTSATIGHRSSRMEYNLEFTGRLYISPKSTIQPPASTPELHRKQQKFIFLG